MNDIAANLVNQAVTHIMPIAISALVAGILWVGKKVGTLTTKKIKESDSRLDDRLAALAVAWVEDKFGPDTGTGREKREAAIDWLVEKSKGRLGYEDAEKLVRAAYQGLFGSLDPLKNEQAP